MFMRRAQRSTFCSGRQVTTTKRSKRLAAPASKAVAIVEAALILEAGAAKRFDRLVVVTCRPEQKVERWARRMNIEEETARREVARRMAAQLSDADKVKAADYVIDNSGSLDETSKQVRSIYASLSAEGGKQ